MLNSESPEQDLVVRNLVLSICDLRQHGDPPSARAGAKAVTLGTRMYVFGGGDERRAYGKNGEVHLLEIEQMKWTTLTCEGAKPSQRFGHTMHAISDFEILVFGGYASETTGDDTATASPEFLGDTSHTWNHCAPEGPNADLFVLDVRSLNWRRVTTSDIRPSGRAFHAGVVCHREAEAQQFFLYGGLEKNEVVNNEAWLLNLKTFSWKKCSHLNLPDSFGHSMCSSEGVMYSFGGNYARNEIDKFEFLPSGELAHTVCSCNGSTPPCGRRFHSLDAIDNRLFVFAGASSINSTMCTDLYVFDIHACRWSRPLYDGGAMSLRAHCSTVMHDKLLVFGGVRDKNGSARISKKLFFLNVLEIKGVTEGDFKFKLVSVGDSGVGKSCLLTRFVNDVYSDFHVSTIGVDFKTVVTMVKGRLVKLQLWDTAGQERFSVVTGNYYRNADGFMLVYDATCRASFLHIDQWIQQIQQHHDMGPNCIKILAGNKYDLASDIVVSETEGKNKAEEIGATFVSTSAKTASNVDFAFLSAAQKLVEIRRNLQQQAQAQQAQQQRVQLLNSSMDQGNVASLCNQGCSRG